MLIRQIDPRGTLGKAEAALIKAKLRNADGLSVVPITVAENTVVIGCDWNEFADDWEFIGRRLGYKVHNV